MFIVEKDYKKGSAVLTGTRPYSSQVWAVNPVPSSNLSTTYKKIDEIVSLGNTDSIYKIYVKDGSDRIRWHRMADGKMIMSEDFGVALRPNIGYMVSSNTYDINNDWGKYLTSESSSTVPNNPGKGLFVTSGASTIGGAGYTVKVMRIGSVPADKPHTEYTNYLQPTGLENWHFGSKMRVSDFRMGSLVGSEFRNAYWIEDGQFKQGYFSLTSNAYATFRLVALPTGAVPTLTPIETDLGIITEPNQVTIQMAGTPTVTAKLDGDQTVQVSTRTGNFTVDLSTVWSGTSYGDHEIICVAEQNGYKTGARIRFNKSASAVMVTTKPHSSANRPTSCRLIGSIVVPTGAVLTQEVTNNGNDDAPTWEPYTGTEHFFSNETKTASQWGLAARVSIDNSDGNAVAEIKDSLAMGVLYEGGAE